ncbi:MAG: hypothetical protein C4291_13575 [Candidatus Dadabacteria bacterium]
MATLSPSSMYDCNVFITIAGFVPRSTIDIYVSPSNQNGSPIRIDGGGTNLSRSAQVFIVDEGDWMLLSHGTGVHATQSYKGDTSEHSSTVKVQSPLS